MAHSFACPSRLRLHQKNSASLAIARVIDVRGRGGSVVVRAREGTKRATRLDLVCRHGGKR